MPPVELLALGSAVCTALAGAVMAKLSGRVHPVAATRWSMIFATLIATAGALVVGGFATLDPTRAGLLALSGFFAIIVAGPGYYTAIFSLGARRALLLFSLNAPLSVLLGVLLLGERLRSNELMGIGIIVAGVALAVLFGGPRGVGVGTGLSERATAVGVAGGLIAALGQAAGNIAAQPAMAAGVEPFTANVVRAGVAALAFSALSLLPFGRRMGAEPVARRDLGTIALSALIGMGVGMSMMLAALAAGHVGVVSTLAATTPVAILPIVWFQTGRAPAWQAWLGAALAVVGTGMIFS